MNQAKKNNSYKYHGLSIYEVGNEEWIIGSEKQFIKIAGERIKEDLWCFQTCYICDFLAEKYPNKYNGQKFFDAIKKLQEELCDDATPIIEALIGNHMDEFISDVIEDDGLGHVLASYDGVIHKTRDIPGLVSGYGPLCFRVN
jgi:hypothetical protein